MLREWRRRQGEHGQTLAEYHVIFSLFTVGALAFLGVNLVGRFASIACCR